MHMKGLHRVSRLHQEHGWTPKKQESTVQVQSIKTGVSQPANKNKCLSEFCIRIWVDDVVRGLRQRRQHSSQEAEADCMCSNI